MCQFKPLALRQNNALLITDVFVGYSFYRELNEEKNLDWVKLEELK